MARVTREWLDIGRYPFSHEVATRYADVDPNRHINNVAMAAAFEDARARFNRSVGLSSLMEGLRSLIVAAQYEYLAEAHYPQSLLIHVAVSRIGRTSWTTSQVAIQDGRICAYCQSTLVITDGTAPTPLPGPLQAKLEAHLLRPLAGA